MTAPDLLERTRMALAEVGYPAEAVRWRDQSASTLTFTAVVPPEVMWRAHQIAKIGEKYVCEGCWRTAIWLDVAAIVAARARCRADRPCVRDCGVPR